MEIDPAITSATPATKTSFEDSNVAKPAANANGTVKPSESPIITSLTTSAPPKCGSAWESHTEGGLAISASVSGIRLPSSRSVSVGWTLIFRQKLTHQIEIEESFFEQRFMHGLAQWID
jgi:hypothetical protein